MSMPLSNVLYREDRGLTPYERERCRLELHLPASRRGFPTLVFFHGGALECGGLEDPLARAVAARFARDGLAVVPATYRLSPAAPFPGYVEDAAAAVAWVLAHIADYGGDPRRVFVSGHSAGGYLAALLGMDRRYLAACGADPAALAGLLPISGQVFTHIAVRKERGLPDPRFKPVIDAAAPCHHARPDAPPLLALCADHDMPLRTDENRYFVALLKAVGHPDAEYLEVADRDHGTIFERMTNPDDPAARAILAFTAKRVGHLPSPAGRG
jgi:acetyl esterase/lipase